MADISQDLQKILDAIYGEEVRGSIYHAISLINDVSEKVIDAGTAVTGAASLNVVFAPGVWRAHRIFPRRRLVCPFHHRDALATRPIQQRLQPMRVFALGVDV